MPPNTEDPREVNPEVSAGFLTERSLRNSVNAFSENSFSVPSLEPIDWVNQGNYSFTAGYNSTPNVVASRGSIRMEALRPANNHYLARQRDREMRNERQSESIASSIRNPSPQSRGGYRAAPGAETRVAGIEHNTHCVHCLRYYDRHDGRPNIRVNGAYICADCASADYIKCAGCDQIIHRLDGHPTVGDRLVCNRCVIDRYSSCCRCNLHVTNDEAHDSMDGYYCTNCQNSMEEDDDSEIDFVDEPSTDTHREFYNGDKKFCSTEAGKIIKSKRIFSAEIECYYPGDEDDQDALREFARAMPRHLGIGTDGSLNDNGIEIRTPILQGSKGEELIRMVCARLIADNFYTDECCGLHIHLDAGKLIPTESLITEPRGLKQLWLYYLTFEDVILSFLPRERRNNSYCRPLKDNFHMLEIRNAINLDELEKIWYRQPNRAQIASIKRDKSHDTKYHGVNIHCLLSQKHLEIRFHSGTINDNKILEWVNLHQTIMDRAENNRFDYSLLKKTSTLVDIKEKTEIFFDMINLPDKSRKYFLSRAEKFADKTADEDKLKTL